MSMRELVNLELRVNEDGIYDDEDLMDEDDGLSDDGDGVSVPKEEKEEDVGEEEEKEY